MRSIVLLSGRIWVPTNGQSQITQVALDLDENAIYAVCEGQNTDADFEIDIYRLRDGPILESSVPCASFPIVSSSPSPGVAQVVSARFLNESRLLAIATRSGDLGTISLVGEGAGEFDVVGSIDAGIKCVAWSPDETFLVLVTGDEKLLLMTAEFDVIHEKSLFSTEDGEDQPVNVGWGSKQTQFHGSLGKTAAQAQGPSLDSIGSSPDDDSMPRISWRGDAGYFAVSYLDTQNGSRPRRVMKVFKITNGRCTLQTVSEPIAGLEHVLSWRPSGNLIASTQRFGRLDGLGAGREGRHDVVFFERNGLRHGEYGLREKESSPTEKEARPTWSYKVRELAWNADSNILAVWKETDQEDTVQLWTTGNYHWYLKQEIRTPTATPRRLSSITWHPENSMLLMLATANSVIEQHLAWEIFNSHSLPPNDTGLVGVVNGASVMLTPFRTQNVPPPMCSHKLQLSISAPQSIAPTPNHVAFSFTGDLMAILFRGGLVQVWTLNAIRQGGGGKRALDPVLFWEGQIGDNDKDVDYRQICVISVPNHPAIRTESNDAPTGSDWCLACLKTEGGEDVIAVAHFELGSGATPDPSAKTHRMSEPGGRLIPAAHTINWQSPTGNVFSVGVRDAEPSDLPSKVAAFPEFCVQAEHVQHGTSTNGVIFVGLSKSGKLHVAPSEALGKSTRLLAANCTSFFTSPDFVVFTTTSHESVYVPVDRLKAYLLEENGDASHLAAQYQWEKRRVERGSRIVTMVPSAMSLVLQMPRGNLETINPRPLVMKVVMQDIKSGNYRKAFISCRKHRIDFKVFMEEENEDIFLKGLPAFVDQVDEVDYLNLFLTNIGQSSLPVASVSKVCDALREQLEAKDTKKYIYSILTAFIVKKPPEHQHALSLLINLRDSEPDLIEDAVKYIIFLVDADTLFDVALGMYDFSLVLLIAQHSQKDPREYLPFLRELRALPQYYQRYRIDDHLKRYPSALNNLYHAGLVYFEEAVSFIEKHRLHVEALSKWKAEPELRKRLLVLYGDYLYERREFGHSALAYSEAQSPQKAMSAYEKGLMWRELFEIALLQNMDQDAQRDIAHRVAEELVSKKRHQEAAQVLLDYAKDVSHAVGALCEGNLFSEARRIVALHTLPDLLVERVHPATLDARAQIAEDLDEMRSQLKKQHSRLRELRVKRAEEPESYYQAEDPNLHNVDAMTDASMAPTAFTRYTAAPSVVSKTSKRSSRSKRKIERKIGSGRKGTVDEEEYLMKSLAKLVTRFEGMQAETSALLPHLLQFTPTHRAEGRALQSEILAFKAELVDVLDEIWDKRPDDEEEQEKTVDSWAARMEQVVRDRKEAIKRIEKPKLGAQGEGRVELLELDG